MKVGKIILIIFAVILVIALTAFVLMKFFVKTEMASNNQIKDTCLHIQDISDKDRCYNKLAQDNKEILFCDKISEDSWKDECYSWVGIAKQDPKVCNNIASSFFKNECCTNIRDTSKKVICS